MLPEPPETITGEVALTVAGLSLKLRLTVPVAPTALSALLPIFQGLANTLVDQAVIGDAAAGRQVSCRAGCGACCRQPVPIAPSEARALVALVAEMPEPRRSVIRERFATGQAKLAAANITISPDGVSGLKLDQQVDWGAAYLRRGVACPFLEDESCSIYPDRPTICREYLVTTSAENCREPSVETIRRVPVPGSVSSALFAVDRELEQHGRVLLIDALDWVAAHPAPLPSRPGPAVIQAVFAALAAES